MYSQPEIISIPDYGQVGAGQVVDFIPRDRNIYIPKPDNINDGDILFSHSVSGTSLMNPYDADSSVRNGDMLICKANFELWEVKPDKICIVFILTTCERLAKKVTVLKNERVALISPNPEFPTRNFPIDDIEIKGIVTGFVRHF